MAKPTAMTESLGTVLREAAREVPDRHFLRMRSGSWTYSEFADEVWVVAGGLRECGVAHGDRVSLLLPNCVEFVVAWFALAEIGAVAVPVNTSFVGSMLSDAIDLVESDWIILHERFAENFNNLDPAPARVRNVVFVGDGPSRVCRPGWRVVTYDSLRIRGGELHVDSTEGRGRDTCLILYTSGTTGRAKAAMISHCFALTQARVTITGLGLNDKDVLYCPYPLFHLDASIMTVVCALVLRGVAAIGERFSVTKYWEEVRELGATVFDFMGATLTMLWKQPPSPLDRQHSARLGWGVPLPSWAPEFEARFGCRLIELYGSTEVGAIIFPPPGEDTRPGSCGKAAEQYQLELHDEDGYVVPVGEPGELVVRPLAPSILMSGYYGMPYETQAACTDLWFHTGDIMRVDEDGYFYFVGRRKDIIRRRGENISANLIEEMLTTHPGVLECAVIGVPSELTEEEVMACIVAREHTGRLDPAELAAYCETRMARYMVPRFIRFLSFLPKTPTDKVEKFRLKKEGVTSDTWDRENARGGING